MLEVSLLIGLVAVGIASLVLWGAGWISGVVKSRGRKLNSERLPSISVLKPVKGATPGLRENLEAIAGQDHPHFEMIICAEDPDDPALRIAREVRRSFPSVPMRVLASPPPFGLNPKVRSLAFMERIARHDLVLVSDSDVRPGTGYLTDLAHQSAAERADFVHSPLVGVGEDSLGAAAESAQFGLWVTQSMAAARAVNHVCVVGKSMMYSKAAFARLGGWRRFRDNLSDDYLVGRAFQEGGLHVALSPYPVPVYTAKRSNGDFIKRHVRWGQLRRSSNAVAYALEPLQNTTLCLGLVVLAGLLTNERQGVTIAGIAFCAWLVRVGMDLYFLRLMRGHALAAHHALAVPLRDVLALVAWGIGAVKTTVDWQGNVMQLRSGATLVPLARQGDVRQPRAGLA